MRIGTVRHPPRGVGKAEYAARDYFDVWLPELAPSAYLASRTFSPPLTAKHGGVFARRYRREITQPAPKRVIKLVAALSLVSFL